MNNYEKLSQCFQVQLIKKVNDDWWLIRTTLGAQGQVPAKQLDFYFEPAEPGIIFRVSFFQPDIIQLSVFTLLFKCERVKQIKS